MLNYLNILDSLKESQRAARRAHFAAGGTPKTWRGSSQKLDESSSKAKQNKRACRDWRSEE